MENKQRQRKHSLSSSKNPHYNCERVVMAEID